MNRIKILLISITAIFLMAMTSCTPKEEMTTDSRAAIDVILKRTSVRTYKDKPISKEDLETIVRAGMAAPTAMNQQPWQFIIVDDKNTLKALGGKLLTSSMTQQAAAAIIVCGDLQKAGEGWLQQYWIQDCSAASQNILLAITDLGMGGVWTSVYPDEERIEIVRGILKLPGHIIPLNIIPLGYPSEDKKPIDKWKPENIHWNEW